MMTRLIFLFFVLGIVSIPKPVSAVDCVDYCIKAYERGWDGKDPNVRECTDGAERMLRRGGSQNWPMNCEMGKSLYSGNWQWFKDYAKYSQNRFHSTEFMSPIYHSNNLAAILHWYIKTDDPEARSILRANWAWITLNMETSRPKKIWSHSNGNVWDATGDRNWYFNPGWTHYSAATRTALPEPEKGGVWHPGSLVNPIMHLMLDLPGRSLRWGVCPSPGWYFPLKSVVRMLGFKISPSPACKVNLMELRPPAESFGITEAERTMLRSHVTSMGRSGDLKEIIKMIDPKWSPACTMTVLKTSDGITGWFGSSSEKGYNCNGNKPPQFAITYNRRTGEGHYLKPYTHCGVGCPRGWTERRGDKIFGHGHYEDSIPVASGNRIYEVTWHNKRGIELVYPEPEPTCDFPDLCFCETYPTDTRCQIEEPPPKPEESWWKKLDQLWVKYRYYILGGALLSILGIILIGRKD